MFKYLNPYIGVYSWARFETKVECINARNAMYKMIIDGMRFGHDYCPYAKDSITIRRFRRDCPRHSFIIVEVKE